MVMLLYEYVIISGTVLLISCVIWLSLWAPSGTMDTDKERSSSVDVNGRSPNRRSRRRMRQPQTSKSAQSQAQGVRQSQRRKVRLVDSSGEVTPAAQISPSPCEIMDVDATGDTTTATAIRQEVGLPLKTSPTPPRDFSHPVYKEMSLKNGSINRMTKDQLQKVLQELGLNNLGSGDVLKRRLKHHNSKELLQVAGLLSTPPARFDYLCVIDVEATCLQINPTDYIHEIIEFPIVLVNTRTLQIEDTFEAFCKPVINPKLSTFCSQLTHISQKDVDKAEEFPAVLAKAEAWMKKKGLGSKFSFAITTDCSLDMDLYLKLQCLVSELPYPAYAREWVNISRVFANLYKIKRLPLRAMLDSIGLGFVGRPHRGIDDAKNIARVALQLLEDGADLKCNEKLTPT